MIATTVIPSFLQRYSQAAIHLFKQFLMASGLIFVLGFAALQSGNVALAETLRAMLPEGAMQDSLVEEARDVAMETESVSQLSPRMRGALAYVAKRYRVSNEALEPIFMTAQLAGREHRIDPLLIVAVIGVESGFNPFSQSVFGAQGLMQVVPRFHLDKLPEEAEQGAFLDPVVNVQVGVRVLKEAIQRYGGLEEGLQQFGGALNDPDRRYAGKVLAEKQRLELALQRLRVG